VGISSWVDTCPFTPLPFKDHPSTSDRREQTAPGKVDHAVNHWQ